MNLSSIIGEVQNRAGDSSLTESQVTTWVNNYIKELATRTDWPWALTTYETDTTTASIQEYALQSDFRKMFGVRVGSAGGTEPTASEQSFIGYIDKNQAIDLSVEGYYLNPTSGKFGLVPTPSSSGQKIYQKYYKIPADMSAVSATPIIPEAYHSLLINSSLERYWEQEDEFDKSVYYNTKAENIIEQMKTDLRVTATGDLGYMKDIRDMTGEKPQTINNVLLGDD